METHTPARRLSKPVDGEPKLIGLVGAKGSGKDTYFGFFRDAAAASGARVTRLAFADLIKTQVHQTYGIPMEVLHGTAEMKETPQEDNPRCIWHGSYAWDQENAVYKHRSRGHHLVIRKVLAKTGFLTKTQLVVENWETGEEVLTTLADLEYQAKFLPGCRMVLTPRRILQKWGTEVARSIQPDTWVNYAFAYLKSAEAALSDVIVITDVRFGNEMVRIEGAGGEVWGVSRDVEATGGAQHRSETEMTTIIANTSHRIENNGSLADLEISAAERWANYARSHFTEGTFKGSP